MAWYRTTPVNVTDCGDGGTIWGQRGSATAKAAVVDVVNVLAVSYGDTNLTVSIGDETKTIFIPAGPPKFYLVSFGEFKKPTGNVTVSMNGHIVEGPAITDKCPESAVVSWSSVAPWNMNDEWSS